MPESELVKLALQGGSFGLLSILFIWVIARGVPMIVASQEKTAAVYTASQDKTAVSHADTVKTLVAEFRAERREQREFDREEWAKRDAVIEKLAAAVDRMSAHVVGCPHHEAAVGELKRRDR